MTANAAAVLWGSELSPYFLKVESMCAYAGLPAQRRPDGGGTMDNLRLLLRLKRAQATRSVRRWPVPDALDEYPLVPYLLTDDGAVHVDSSGIAGWLDATYPSTHDALVPGDAAIGFACRLLDEAFDEIGLYCVHHHRWVVSRHDNTAGSRLAHEFRSLLPIAARVIARRFAARQTRRLPYLLSVAPMDAHWPDDGLPVPPARTGFLSTHARLEQAWDALVDAATHALERHPFLLGGRFTLADAALYGQLGMNLSDPSSERRLRARSPRLRRWLADIAAGRHVASTGPIAVHDGLRPLIDWAHGHFVPLMRANASAYEGYRARGARRWNEAAFDRGEALFDMEWGGAPLRTVVKTFQVRVWRDLCAAARAVPAGARTALTASGGDWPVEWR